MKYRILHYACPSIYLSRGSDMGSVVEVAERTYWMRDIKLWGRDSLWSLVRTPAADFSCDMGSFLDILDRQIFFEFQVIPNFKNSKFEET